MSVWDEVRKLAEKLKSQARSSAVYNKLDQDKSRAGFQIVNPQSKLIQKAQQGFRNVGYAQQQGGVKSGVKRYFTPVPDKVRTRDVIREGSQIVRDIPVGLYKQYQDTESLLYPERPQERRYTSTPAFQPKTTGEKLGSTLYKIPYGLVTGQNIGTNQAFKQGLETLGQIPQVNVQVEAAKDWISANLQKLKQLEINAEKLRKAYDTLGIKPGTNPKEVYRELAKVQHPDKGGSEEAFKIINEAYKKINDAGLLEKFLSRLGVGPKGGTNIPAPNIFNAPTTTSGAVDTTTKAIVPYSQQLPAIVNRPFFQVPGVQAPFSGDTSLQLNQEKIFPNANLTTNNQIAPIQPSAIQTPQAQFTLAEPLTIKGYDNALLNENKILDLAKRYNQQFEQEGVPDKADLDMVKEAKEMWHRLFGRNKSAPETTGKIIGEITEALDGVKTEESMKSEGLLNRKYPARLQLYDQPKEIQTPSFKGQEVPNYGTRFVPLQPYQVGYKDIRGNKISSPEDVGSLLKDFRNNEQEVLHHIYIKDGKVVAHNATTSKDISSVNVNKKDFLFNIEDRMKRLGADSVYLAHNHPSGNADLSSSDKMLGSLFQEKLGNKFGGLIALDHDQMGIQTKSGTKLADVDLGKSYASNAPRITSYEEAKNLVLEHWDSKSGKTGVFILSNDNRPVGYEAINTKGKTELQINDTLTQLKKKHSGSSIILATANESNLTLNYSLNSDFLDVLDVFVLDKQEGLISLKEQGKSFGSEVQQETGLRDIRLFDSSKDKPATL